MSLDHPRGTIARICTFDVVVGLIMIGLASWLLTLNVGDVLWQTALGGIVLFAGLIWLAEPFASGVSRRETNALRREIRPRWHTWVFFGVFGIFAVLAFPDFPAPFSNPNVGSAFLFGAGMSVLATAVYNLANPRKPVERGVTDAG